MSERTEKKQKKSKLWLLILLILLILAAVFGWLYMSRQEKEVPFAGPTGMLLAEDGSIYVADYENNNIVRMEEEKTFWVAGHTLPLNDENVAQGGYADGRLDQALFNRPFGIAPWGEGYAVSDMNNHCIRLVTDSGVRTLAGTGLEGGHNDRANLATFNAPAGLATDEEGNLYIADSGNGMIRCLSPEGQVSTVAEDLKEPMGICWSDGELYIASAGTNQILKLDASGEIKVVAGMAYEEKDVSRKDGSADHATFCAPQGVEVVDGIVYVADTGFSAIRKVQDGQVTTLKYFEGTGNDLWPSRPIDLVCKGDRLYVSDTFNGVIFTVDI